MFSFQVKDLTIRDPQYTIHNVFYRIFQNLKHYPKKLIDSYSAIFSSGRKFLTPYLHSIIKASNGSINIYTKRRSAEFFTLFSLTY